MPPESCQRRAVFRFQVEVVEGSAKRESTTETDTAWEDFRRHVHGLLENVDIELTYKLTGDTGKASHLATRADFDATMERLCHKALSARSWAVAMEAKNIVSCYILIERRVGTNLCRL